MIGTGTAKAVTLLAIPVVTRLYTPEAMGIYAVFMSIVNIAAPAMTFRYVVALPLPRSDAVARSVFSVCLINLAISATLFSFLLIYAGPTLFRSMNMPGVYDYKWLVICGIVGACIYEMAIQWAIRKRAFGIASRSQVGQSISSAATKVALGYLGFGVSGLLLGAILERAGGILGILIAFRRDMSSVFRRLSFRRISFVYRRYSDLPYWRLPAQVVMSTTTQIPIFAFAYLYTPYNVGQLSLCFSMLFATSALISQTTGKAFLGEVSRIGRNDVEGLTRATNTMVTRAAMFSAIPCLVLAVGGHLIFSYVFGQQWQDAGQYAQILSILLLADIVGSPYPHVLTVLGQNRYIFLSNLSRTLISVLVFSLCAYFSIGPLLALLFYSSAVCLNHIIVGIGSHRILTRARPNRQNDTPIY